jgi:hypothetical protein
MLLILLILLLLWLSSRKRWSSLSTSISSAISISAPTAASSTTIVTTSAPAVGVKVHLALLRAVLSTTVLSTILKPWIKIDFYGSTVDLRLVEVFDSVESRLWLFEYDETEPGG